MDRTTTHWGVKHDFDKNFNQIEMGNESGASEWQTLQYKAFLRWTNHALSKRALKIGDFKSGLQDGLMLHALLEVLSEKTVRGMTRRARMRIQMINNHFLLFEFMKTEAVPLENIGPEDIVDQDLKLILGLIWSLMLHYAIGRHIAPIPDAHSTSSALPGPSSPAAAPRQTAAAQMLQNLQVRLAPYEPMVPRFPSLSLTLSDGRPLLALIHSRAPELVGDLSAVDPNDHPAAVHRAFSLLAHPSIRAPLLLDAEDIISGAADDKSLMAFLGGLFDALDACNPSAVSARAASQPPSRSDPALEALDALVSGLTAPAAAVAAVAPAKASTQDPALRALDGLISGLTPAPGSSQHPSCSSSSTAAAPVAKAPTQDIALNALDSLIGGLSSAPTSAKSLPQPTPSKPTPQPAPSQPAVSKPIKPVALAPHPRVEAHVERDIFDDLVDGLGALPRNHPLAAHLAQLAPLLRNFSDGLDSIDERAPSAKQALRSFDPASFLEMLVSTIGRPVQAIVSYLEADWPEHAAAIRAALMQLLLSAKELAALAEFPGTTPQQLGQSRDNLTTKFSPLVEALLAAQAAILGGVAPSPRRQLAGPRSTADSSSQPSQAQELLRLAYSPEDSYKNAAAVLEILRGLVETIRRDLDWISDPADFRSLQQALVDFVALVNAFIAELNAKTLQPSTCHKLQHGATSLEDLWRLVVSRAGSAPRSAADPDSAAEGLAKIFSNPDFISKNAGAILEQLKQIITDATALIETLDQDDARQLVHKELQEFHVIVQQFIVEMNAQHITSQTCNVLIASLRKLEDAMRRGQDMCRKYCAGCSKEIVGGYSIVDSKPLHSGCFVCHTCKHPLTRYFMDGGKFYCPDHIPGKQRMSCHACHQPITGAYVEVTKNPFHPDCLKCTKCRTVLEGSFHLMQNQPYCASCP